MQTAKLVKTFAKDAKLKQLPSKNELKSRQCLWYTATIMMPLIGIALVIVGTLQFSNTKPSFSFPATVVWISCCLVALILAICVRPAAKYARLYARLRSYYYEEVLKGRYKGVVLANNRKDLSVISVMIKGENRAKQPLTSVANMPTKTWREKIPAYGQELVVRNGVAK